MGRTIEVSDAVAAAIQAAPDGMERVRRLLEAEFLSEINVEPCEGAALDEMVSAVNAALDDRRPGLSPEEMDNLLEQRLPWLKTPPQTNETA